MFPEAMFSEAGFAGGRYLIFLEWKRVLLKASAEKSLVAVDRYQCKIPSVNHSDGTDALV